MIARFSLYGFLKNMRFFEPFFLLFLREKGLSFFEIGILFGVQEIAINAMEIPSGAIADLYGRKSAMLLSLSSYILSFVLFALSGHFYILLGAVLLFAIGEAFRTGTHKAIIFDYLKHENRTNEKTKIYGFTRSWSQKGSALSVLFATTIVFFSNNYTAIFWFSIIPYVIGFANIYSYPSYLNKKVATTLNLKDVFHHLIVAFKLCLKKGSMRSLLISSLLFSGQFKSVKYYLQTIIKAQAGLIPLLLIFEAKQQIALLSGAIYFFLYLLTSYASKNSHKLEAFFGSKKKASLIIIASAICFAVTSGLAIYFEQYFVAIVGFMILFSLQNMWRPIMVSQFDDAGKGEHQATILSIESQSISLGVIIIAPLMGYFADNFGTHSVFVISMIVLCIAMINNRVRVS